MNIIDQIVAAEREKAFRKSCYPKWVAIKKMTQQEADHQLEAINEIINTLKKQQELENYLLRNFPNRFLGVDSTTINTIALIERCKVLMTTHVKDLTDFIQKYLPDKKFTDFEKEKIQDILTRSKDLKLCK